MKEAQLNRILHLIKKTNDKLVVLDRATDEAHVVMSLDSYEDLFDGNAGTANVVPPYEPTDGGVASADDEDPNGFPPDFSNPEIIKDEIPDIKNEPRNTSPLDFSGSWPARHVSQSDTDWAAHNAPTESTEESLSDVPHEEEEEKFYLEPVE